MKTDYQGNSKDPKKLKTADKPEKNITKVVTGPVVVKKKPLGHKLKGLFLAADLGSVSHYIFNDVLVPALRNMLVDGATQAIERTVYGDAAVRRGRTGPRPRMQYNDPTVQRTNYRDATSREAPRRRQDQGPVRRNNNSVDFVLSSREEAKHVLEVMTDIVDQFQEVSVGDLKELVGERAVHTDSAWGWTDLDGASVTQLPDGFLIDLPSPDPL